jgi:hypothetical protein
MPLISLATVAGLCRGASEFFNCKEKYAEAKLAADIF